MQQAKYYSYRKSSVMTEVIDIFALQCCLVFFISIEHELILYELLLEVIDLNICCTQDWYAKIS